MRPRTNTIFGVAHAAGMYTAWSDKHPSYSSVSGPGTGNNVDDYYAPEINSFPVNLPGVKFATVNCNPLPDPTAKGSVHAWTDSFQKIQCYDTLKVKAVVNEINGKTHNGSASAPVPAIFGMNFQAVSVGEKLIETTLTPTVRGGYLDSQGTPTSALLGEIAFVDYSLGQMFAALKANHLYNSTLIVITAKHGQSPIASSRYLGISTVTGDPITTSPANIADNSGCLPLSESPSNPTGIGPTEDDVSMLWLNTSCTTAEVVGLLQTQSPSISNIAGIGEIFWGPGITQLFKPPGTGLGQDPRTPDILVTPNIGVTYSGSGKKLAEHGGFSHDDTNVMMLLENPSLALSTITTPVETMQVAPAILQALGLNPRSLQSVHSRRVRRSCLGCSNSIPSRLAASDAAGIRNQEERGFPAALFFFAREVRIRRPGPLIKFVNGASAGQIQVCPVTRNVVVKAGRLRRVAGNQCRQSGNGIRGL